MMRIHLAPGGQTAPDWPGIPSWLGRLLLSRGVDSPEKAEAFLHPALDQLLPPGRLYQMDDAVSLLTAARDAGKRAVIYGDYDVDGVSACAILKEAFDLFGLSNFVYIPDRHQEGYGLNLAAVEKLAAEAGLLITVDCGITSIREVEAAKAAGMQVIVTDHHRHLEELPPADAVISPLLGDYPFPYLCGAGVAWKLACALIGERALPYLEIAALATVADMVPLTGENRVIAALGLKQLSVTGRLGLRAVMSRAGICGQVSSEQVGFQIAPRMNACGRLDSARIALSMLLTRDRDEAEALAVQMENLNQRRRAEEDAVLRDALEQVKAINLMDTHAIVVWGEGWNSGVVGLAAGRIAEKYAYPTVALARQGDLCVGSARSAGEVDIYAALTECADLFVKFGGHRQAAGLTIPWDKVEEFRKRLSQAVSAQTGGLAPRPVILCDGEMALRDVTPENVRWLSMLEPFGMGNASPRFLCEGALPISMKAVGAEGKHLRCMLRQDSALRDGIFFGGGDLAGQTDGSYRLALTPTINEFHGKISAECRLYGMELLPESLEPHPAREMLAFIADARSEDRATSLDDGALDALMAGGQGTLLVCRCRETALALRRRFPQADFAVGKAADPRAYHTVLLYGAADRVSAPYRRVVLCDGDTGEAAAWRQACPNAEVAALPATDALRQLLSQSFVDVAGLRDCYQRLRERLPRDVYDAAGLFARTPPQSAFALGVLSQIGLIDLSLSPFRAALLPMVKRSPEDSPLFRLARQGKEETHGSHGV